MGNSVSKNCNEYERLSKSVKFLIDEKKILSLHTVWKSEEEGKLKQTFFVSKCTQVDYFITFLQHEFGIPTLFVFHKGKRLDPELFLYEYEIANNDELVLFIPGLEGGGRNEKAKVSCSSCSYYCESEKLLEAHTNECHPELTAFTEKTNFLDGYLEDQKKKDDTFQENHHKCYFCDNSFKNKHALDIHCQRMHKNKFFCESCKKEFKSKAVFTRHNNSEHGGVIMGLSSEAAISELIKCQTCESHFKTEALMIQHMKSSHQFLETSTDNQLKCHQCQKDFKTKATLTRHNNLYHSEKP